MIVGTDASVHIDLLARSEPRADGVALKSWRPVDRIEEIKCGLDGHQVGCGDAKPCETLREKKVR